MSMFPIPNLNANYNIKAHLTKTGIDYYDVSPNSFAIKDITPWSVPSRKVKGIQDVDIQLLKASLSSNTPTLQEKWPLDEMISAIERIYAKYHVEPEMEGNKCKRLIFGDSKKEIPLFSEEKTTTLNRLIQKTDDTLYILRNGDLSQRFLDSSKIPNPRRTLQGNAEPSAIIYSSTAASAPLLNDKTSQLCELFSLTESLNREIKQKKDYGFMLSSAASIVSLASVILTLDTPKCSDEAFSSHIQTVQILQGITSLLAGAAGSASFRNRSITLPSKASFTSEFYADSRFDEKEEIRYQKSVKQSLLQLPSFLLPESAQIIRQNMQFLGEYTARQAFLMKRPSNHHQDPAIKKNLSEVKRIDLQREAHAYLTTAKIVSLTSASVLGMLAMFASAGIEGAIAITTQQSRLCNASSPSDPNRDEPIDLTNLAIIPFGLTLLGTALFLINRCFRSQDPWNFQKETRNTNNDFGEPRETEHVNFLSAAPTPRASSSIENSDEDERQKDSNNLSPQ